MITRALCPALVGREEEVSLLEDALLAACRGEGQVVVLAGDAGMGKSRLASELRRRAEKLGCTIFEGSCSEADLSLPYLPFLEAVGNHLAATDVASLRERLGPSARELASLFPDLADGSTTPLSPDDSSQSRLRLFEALLAVLRFAAEAQGVLLTLEDLHWADASTRELLDYLTRRVRGLRILVLATYRRDEMHRRHPLLPVVQGWRRSRLAQVVELEPLDQTHVAQMVAAIFDQPAVSEEFAGFIQMRAEGNPFVVEEMLKSALDRGDIYRDGDGWQRRALEDLRIPDTVRDTILLRTERLPENTQHVLRCAATLGRTFDYALLGEVAEVPVAELEGVLESLCQEQLLEEEEGARGRYRFRHALTQEAVYQAQAGPRRERLHSRAADVLATWEGASMLERVQHLLQAHRATEAAPLCIAAAAAAHASFAFDEEAELLERALPYVTDALEHARITARLGEALQLADRRTASEVLGVAVTELEACGEIVEAQRCRLVLGRSHWSMQRPHNAAEEYETARATLEPLGPSADLARAYLRLAGMRCFALDGRAAQPLAQRAIEIAESCGADAERINAYNYLGLALIYQGHLKEGVSSAERSWHEASAHGLHDIAANAAYNVSTFYPDLMEPRKSLSGADFLETTPVPQWRLRGQFIRALALLCELRLPESLNATQLYLDSARDQDAGPQAVYRGRQFQAALAIMMRLPEASTLVQEPDFDKELQDAITDALLCMLQSQAQGDHEGALAMCRAILEHCGPVFPFFEAIVYAVEHGHREEAEAALATARAASTEECWDTLPDALLSRAVIALARGDAEQARALMEPLLEKAAAGESRMHEVTGRCLLGEALWALGQRDDGQGQLQRALDMAQERGALNLSDLVLRRAQALGVDLAQSKAALPRDAAADARPEERLVSVLFADVRGYTDRLRATTPTDMADRLAALQRWATSEVRRNHGVLDKFAGDAIMATFNVSGASLDHTLHALQAGLALRDKAALLDLPLGVGIAVGPAVVGSLARGANLSVVGEATNLAARLQSAAGPGDVLLSVEAHRRVSRWLAEHGFLSSAERLELKGFAEGVDAFRLLSHSARTSEAAQVSPATP